MADENWMLKKDENNNESEKNESFMTRTALDFLI